MHNALVALIVCWLVVLTLTLLGRGRSDAQLTQLARLTRGGEATSVELEMHKMSTTSDEQWRFPPSMTFLEALRTYENKGGVGGGGRGVGGGDTERGDRPSTTRHSRPATLYPIPTTRHSRPATPLLDLQGPAPGATAWTASPTRTSSPRARRASTSPTL